MEQENGQTLVQMESVTFVEKVKQTIFQVLYVLRKDEGEDSDGLFYIQTGLDYFQMHTFPFNNSIYYLWKADGVISFVLNFVNLFQLSTYIPNISYFALLSSVYILLVIILLIILDIIYVSYSFSKNQFAVTWPLVVLRSVTSLVVTVLFLPITETLFSILQCSTNSETGEYTISGYNEIYVVCWQGWHTFHALLTLLFMSIFVAICGIVAYAFFEPAMMTEDRTARQDSNGEVAFIINKVSCQVLYCFLGQNQTWVLIISTFILAVWLFKEYNFEDPYYDFHIGRFYSIISSYYLWANIMLLVCKICETTSFNGGFIAWIIGVPFIVSIMLMTKKSKIETLVTVQKKITSGKEIWAHIRYVLQLIQQQEVDRNSYMLLIGYIEKHKETCKYNDCYFKISRKRSTELDINESIRGLLQELEKMFKDGIKKFPKSTELRIFYALFIFERKKNKEAAYKQFEMIDEKCKPALYQQFIIYRYMKSIKENKKENQEDDIVEAIKFINSQTMCEKSMQQSAKLQKDFWGELKEDQPDLGKLMKLGADITYVTKAARQNFEEMQKISQNMYQCVKIYSNFILYVLNDQKLGGELKQQANNIKEELQQEFGGRNEIVNLENQPIPYIQVSAKKADIGKITNANTLFTTFFGYQKEEIVNKSVNSLMPKIYADRHDNYLTQFFDNIVLNLKLEGEIESSYLDTDITQIFKHKNGYIVSFIYKVTLNLETLKYLATFKSENTIRSQIIFLVDSGSKILEMSSGAIIFFDLELKQIEKEVYLNTYIPNILLQGDKHIQYNHQSKDGTESTYFFACSVKEITLPQHFDEEMHEKLQIGEDNNQKTGQWIVKLEKLEKNEVSLGGQVKKGKGYGVSTRQLITNTNNTNPGSAASSSRHLQAKSIVNQSIDGMIPKFENLEFDQQYAAFLSELYSEPKYDDYRTLLNQQVESEVNPIVDYSCEIVTRRLIFNQILNIDEEKELEFLQILEEEEEENSIFRFNQNQFEDEDDYKIFAHKNSQDLIRRVLNLEHKHMKITEFKVYSNLWIFFIFFITILQYLFCQSYFLSYKDSIKSIYLVNNEIIYNNQIISSVLNLCLPTQQNITQTYEDLQSAANQTTSFNRYINSPLLASYFNREQNNVTLRFYDESVYTELMLDLESALLLITTLALNTSLSPNQTFGYQSNIIQNIFYNHFNVIHQAILRIANELYANVADQMDQYDVNLLITLGILILVTSMAMTKFVTLMLSIKMDRENILFLFLDIPQKHIQVLYKKVEYFIKNYISIEELKRKNELEGYDSSEEEQLPEENIKVKNPDEEENFIQLQLKRKKIIEKYRKNKFKGNQAIIIQFVFIALCTLIFAVYNIISSASERSQIRYLLPQYFSGSLDISNYGQYLNVFKLAVLDSKYQILNNTAYEYIYDGLSTFTGNQLSSVGFASQLLGQLETLRDMYFGTYYNDICVELGLFNDQNCYDIIEGNLALGVFNVEQYYLQYFREQLASQEVGNVIFDPYIFEIDNSLYYYVRKAVDQIQSYELNMMTNQMTDTLNIQLILLIIFILLLMLIFAIYWLPFLSSINTQINQNIQMLNMIPIDVIKDNKTIRRFVKNLIKDMDVKKDDSD